MLSDIGAWHSNSQTVLQFASKSSLVFSDLTRRKNGLIEVSLLLTLDGLQGQAAGSINCLVDAATHTRQKQGNSPDIYASQT